MPTFFRSSLFAALFSLAFLISFFVFLLIMMRMLILLLLVPCNSVPKPHNKKTAPKAAIFEKYEIAFNLRLVPLRLYLVAHR